MINMHINQTTKPSSQSQETPSFVRLLSFSRPHATYFFQAFVVLILAVSAEMAIPWLAKIIIDDVIVPQNFEWVHLATLAGFIMLLYIISALFTYWQAVKFRHGALLVVNDIRKELFNHILHFPISIFDKSPSGKLMSFITNDTEALRDVFVTTIPTIIQGSLRILGIFIIIALLDWGLMILSLVLIPVLLYIMHLYRKISMPVFNGIRIQVSNINSHINESLQGIALIQAFRQHNFFQEKFNIENQQWYSFRKKSIALDSLMLNPLTRFISTLTATGIIAWFAGTSLTTSIEVGTLFAFLNYIERFFEPFRQLSMELRKLQVATVSSRRIFELLDDDSCTKNASEITADDHKLTDIEFRHVSLSYEKDKPVLFDINFTAKSGEFTAIVGHTGSGKSSIINLLMRFYEHQKGDILLAGQPISNFSDSQLRRLIGLVAQDPVIFNGNLLENIDLSNNAPNRDKAILAAETVNANQFIQHLPNGYEYESSNNSSTLSVGEKQLLALARAISHDPKIFLFDEATANIDSESEEAVKRALENVLDKRTVIMIAHRLSTIKNADKILVMNKGKIVQSGTHNELIKKEGDYRNLYLAQKNQEENEHINNKLGLTDVSLT